MKYEKLESLPTDKAFLHFEVCRLGVEEFQVDYELVIPLTEADCRGTFDHKGAVKRPKSWRMVWLDKANNKRLPLGRCKVGTGNQLYPFSHWDKTQIDLPFRDGAHSGWDNERLGGLPLIYTTTDGQHYRLFKDTSK